MVTISFKELYKCHERTILLEIEKLSGTSIHMHVYTHTQDLQMPHTHEKTLTAGENKMPFYTIYGRKAWKMPIAGGFGLRGKYKLVLCSRIKMPTPYDLGLSFCLPSLWDSELELLTSHAGINAFLFIP